MDSFEHHPHPHAARRLEKTAEPPAQTTRHRTGVNGRAGLVITAAVGTMWCAYIFTAVALISLPAAISSHSTTVIIAWLSSNFIQLVLLPVIIVGQNAQSRAADERSIQTYQDAEAILHEVTEIQRHLAAQDIALPSSDLSASVRVDADDKKTCAPSVPDRRPRS